MKLNFFSQFCFRANILCWSKRYLGSHAAHIFNEHYRRVVMVSQGPPNYIGVIGFVSLPDQAYALDLMEVYTPLRITLSVVKLYMGYGLQGSGSTRIAYTCWPLPGLSATKADYV